MARSGFKGHCRFALTLAILVTASLWTSYPKVSEASADEKPRQVRGLPEDLALVPPQVIGFLRIQVAELWKSKAGEGMRQSLGTEMDKAVAQMEKDLGVTYKDMETATLMLVDLKGNVEGPGGFGWTVTTAKPFNRDKILQAIVPNASSRDYRGKTYYSSPKPYEQVIHFVNERTFLVGSLPVVRIILDHSETGETPEILASLLRSATQKHHFVLGVNVSDDVRQRMKTDPQPEGLRFLTPLFELQSATATLDFGKETKLRVELHYPNVALTDQALPAAKQGLSMIQQLAPMLTAQVDRQRAPPHTVKFLEETVRAIQKASLSKEGSIIRLVVTADYDESTVLPVSTGIVLQITQQVRAAANRMSSASAMRQMAIGMHSFANDNGVLPPAAIYSKDGKPLLSWRVAILPYMGEDAFNLFKEFKLDELWDSQHNKKLIEKMPAFYRHPGMAPKESYTTVYQVFTGKGTAFEGSRGISLPEISGNDGTANTLLLIEATYPVIWTKPEDISFDAKKPLPKFNGEGKNQGDGFNATFCDGSTMWIGSSVEEKVLRAMITRNGGEEVDREKLPK